MTEPKPLVPTSWPRRIVKSLVTIPLALWIFLEEWVWDSILAFMNWLGKLPPIHWAETKIAKLPPYAALIVFVVPAIVLFPFKLAALWLIAHGHKTYGVCVFIIAKIVGTAFLARIFSLTKPALMTIGWFNKAYTAFSHWKERLYAYVRALPTYQRVKAWAKEIKAQVKAWWQARRQH